MPFTLSTTHHSPLCFEVELAIRNIDKLVQNVAFLMLGKHRHVAAILANKASIATPNKAEMIDRAQRLLVVMNDEERYRRDGWLFQLMTWNSLRMEHPNVRIHAQIPHDNPAQHGIDGLGIILTGDNRIKALIIAEDKYTEKPRSTIKNQVWPEFKLFEKGEYESQLVNRATGLLQHLSDEELDQIITNDIYVHSKRVYRVGITPLANKSMPKHRRKLFKDFDDCVKGPDFMRRQGLTFSQPDIRKWMDDFSLLVSDFLETQRP